MLNKKKNNKGFTLVELLVVIAIIGILAVVAVPALFKNIEKSKVASLESDISAIKSATVSYVTDKNLLPFNQSTADQTGAGIKATLNNELDGISNPYKATYKLISDKNTGVVALEIVFSSPLNTESVSKLEKDLANMKFGDTVVNTAGTTLKVVVTTANGLNIASVAGGSEGAN